MHGVFLAQRPGREKAVNFGYIILDAALQTGKGKIGCALALNLCGLLTCEFIPLRLPIRRFAARTGCTLLMRYARSSSWKATRASSALRKPTGVKRRCGNSKACARRSLGQIPIG